MTVVVAVQDGFDLYMCSDTMDSDGTMKYYGPKIIKHGKLLIGVCGNGMLSDIVERVLKNPKAAPKDLTREGLRDFGLRVFKKLKADTLSTTIEGTLLMGVLAASPYEPIQAPASAWIPKIYSMGLDGCIYEHKRYMAIGCGGDFAMGFMYGRAHNLKGSDLALKAVQTACYFNPECEEPSEVFKI